MRLELIDGIRGHLLVGMLVAHLSFHPGMQWLVTFHHHTLFRVFDAEFFILIAGFLVGYLARRRILDHAGKGDVIGVRFAFARYLGKRIAVVFAYHFVAGVALVQVTAPGGPSWHGLWVTAVKVASFQDAAKYGDVLALYILCFLALLVAVGALGLRALPLLLLSAGVYVISQFSFHGGFWGIGGANLDFDAAAWQFPLVLAFALGLHHRAIGRWLSGLRDAARLILVVCLFGLSLYMAQPFNAPSFAVPQPGTMPYWPRLQLHPVHLLRIFVLAAAVTLLLTGTQRCLAWPRAALAGYFRLPFLRALGRYSIRAFVFHLVLIASFTAAFHMLSAPQRSALALFLITLFLAAPVVVEALGRWSGTWKSDPETRP